MDQSRSVLQVNFGGSWIPANNKRHNKIRFIDFIRVRKTEKTELFLVTSGGTSTTGLFELAAL